MHILGNITSFYAYEYIFTVSFQKLLHQRLQGVQFHYYDFFETSRWEFTNPVRMHIIHFLTSNNGSSKWKMPTHDRQNWFDDTINNIDCEAILIDGVKHFAHIEFILMSVELCFAFKSKVLGQYIYNLNIGCLITCHLLCYF